MAAQLNPANPYNLCNFNPAADCTHCPVNGKVFCHFKPRDAVRFIALFFGAFLPSAYGFVHSGNWGLIVFWFAVFFVFLQVPENLILCSHCPYYAQGERRTLLCHANAGLLKLWPFNPAPMARWEQAGFLLGVGLALGGPVALNFWLGEPAAALLGLAGGIGWALVMRRYVCSECPNFSCPLNTVPREIVDAYLLRNRVFAEAWDRAETPPADPAD
ncbi:MAG: hypothetical protein JW910_09115 [Anaerolineae bacterium]|nr:hypothetical protein [Anaerolineae bacterium]